MRSKEGGPFAAVIVKDDEIIAEGTNCVTLTNDPTAHAEIVAIRKACTKLDCFELRDCELYSSCQPCPMCFGAIYRARAARIFFASTASNAAKVGFDDSLIYSEIRKPYADRQIPMMQIMRDEAMQAFSVWEREPNKHLY